MADDLTLRDDMLHDEQLLVWAGELAFDLHDELREIGDYDDGLRQQQVLKDACADLAKKVLDHPALADALDALRDRLAEVERERDLLLETCVHTRRTEYREWVKRTARAAQEPER